MAVISTKTLTVNAAYFQEIKQDNERLNEVAERTRKALSRELIALRPAARMLELLSELRDQLATHFALEEAVGYFEDPIAVAPRISRHAESLRQEHETLYAEIADLAEEAERIAYEPSTHRDVVRLIGRFRQFDHRWQQHETAENELIFEAFFEDLGVGD